MKIVIDENIPFGIEAFSTLGEVRTMAGRDISKADLADAEVLAVRSITKVNAVLLEGTAVRYVATATIGTDHLDMEWMDSAGIRHCSAPGCNADSVADYITAALLHAAEKQGAVLEGKILGVVGCGNVGSRVARRGRALGMKVLENDPPLARQTGDERYRPLEELFQADYITVHTPLTRDGQDPTYHLVDEVFLGKMEEQAFLLNTSRGAVVANGALKSALRAGWIAGAVLDVWEGEPSIDPELVEQVHLATPHIAGYSFDGKTNGTTRIYRQICEWLEVEPVWNVDDALPPPDVPKVELAVSDATDEDWLRRAVFAVYPIARDDGSLRETLLDCDEAARGRAFDGLRKNYPRRREFSWTKVFLSNASESLMEKFRRITFQVEKD